MASRCFMILLSFLLPNVIAWTSCATYFGMPPILESPTSTSFTEGPSMTALSYTWTQYVTPTIVGTIHVVINTDNNVTTTFTSTNSEYATNGSMRIITRTDTNVAGTVTSVVTALDGSNITVAYPTEAFAPGSELLWNAALPTTVQAWNVTCCDVRQTSSPTPNHAPFPMPTTTLNNADPSGWLYSLQAVSKSDTLTLPSWQISSLWSDRLIQLPYTGCAHVPCNITTSCVAADAAQAANPASFMYATTTKIIGSTTSSLMSTAARTTSVAALPLEEHSASSDTGTSETGVEQSTLSMEVSPPTSDNSPISSTSRTTSSHVSTVSTTHTSPNGEITRPTSDSTLTVTVHSTLTIDTTMTSYDDLESATLFSASDNSQRLTKSLDMKSAVAKPSVGTEPISLTSSYAGSSASVQPNSIGSSPSYATLTPPDSTAIIYPSNILLLSTSSTIVTPVHSDARPMGSMSAGIGSAALASPIMSQHEIGSSTQAARTKNSDISSDVPSTTMSIDSTTSTVKLPSTTSSPSDNLSKGTIGQSVVFNAQSVTSQSAIGGYVWSGVAGTAVTTAPSSNPNEGNISSSQLSPNSTAAVSNTGWQLQTGFKASSMMLTFTFLFI